SASHQDLRTHVRAGDDVHRVHQGLDQAEPPTAVVAARVTPAATVANLDRDLVTGEGGIDLHRRITGTICMFDRVRTRLVAGEDDVVALGLARLALGQPAPQCTAEGSQLERL